MLKNTGVKICLGAHLCHQCNAIGLHYDRPDHFWCARFSDRSWQGHIFRLEKSLQSLAVECKLACNIDPLRGLFASNSDPL